MSYTLLPPFADYRASRSIFAYWRLHRLSVMAFLISLLSIAGCADRTETEDRQETVAPPELTKPTSDEINSAGQVELEKAAPSELEDAARGSTTPIQPHTGSTGQGAAADKRNDTGTIEPLIVPIGLEALKKLLAMSRDGEPIEPDKRLVVVDLWSTSCLPCMREFPQLVALSRSRADQVRCISVNIDYIGLKKKSPADYLPRVERFLSSMQAETVENFLATDKDETVREFFNVSAIPAIMIYDSAGKLLHRFTDNNAAGEGVSYATDVVPALNALLTRDDAEP